MDFKRESIKYNQEVIRILQTYKAIIKFSEEKVYEMNWESLEKTREHLDQKSKQI